MFPDSLTPYADRVALLLPAVLDDVWSPSPGATARAERLAAAIGALLRHADAAEACGEDGASSRRAVGGALLAPRRAQLPTPADVSARMIALARRSQAMAISDPPPAVRTGLDRARDPGDADAAADRLRLLEEADDLLSIAVVLRELGRPVPPDPLRDAGLRVARHLVQGISEATRWRIEAAAEVACRARELWSDPVGRPLWMPIVEPSERPALLAEARQDAAPLRLAAAAPEVRTLEPPGRVTVLLWDPASGLGHPVPLVIAHDPAARVWGSDERWAPTAWRALRAAYVAAGARLAGGPPPAFEAHRVRLLGDVQVDGESLGLAAALAFYGLWTGQSLPEGTAATGAVDPATGRVGPVAGVDAKAAAWRASLGASGGPLLVPDPAAGVPFAVPCATVAGALAACGLEPRPATLAVDVAGRVAQLRSVVEAARLQELGGWVGVAGGDPWALLGDRIAVLVRSLEGVDADVDLREAQVQGALAWLHAGEVDQAAASVQGIGEGPLPPRLRLLAATAALAAAIDRDVGGAEEDAEITALLASADGVERVRYQALGTQGRWRMHRRLPGAVDLLEAAVAAAPAWERGRTRVYLGMALRQAGDAGSAWGALAQAERDLDAQTEGYSRSYSGSTRVFLRYEQARTALALGRAAEAAGLAQEALAGASPGFWPRVGILRVRAQASRAAGRTEDAARAVAALEGLLPGVPSSHRDLVDRILAEARGEQVEPPVVY
jgi:tetratricopeptide (TPR) repeat protein